MRKIHVFFILASLLIPTVTIAEGTSSAILASAIPATHPASLPSPPSSDFKVSGYVDGSYNYLAKNYFTSGSFDRVFDLVPNGLTLQQSAIVLAYQPKEGFGGLLNFIMGRDANGTAPYGFIPASEFDSQTLAIDFPQAFLQYTKGSFTVLGGRFLTLIGNEQVDPTQDTNFSRSVLFYSTPDTHTGIRGIYTLNDKVSFTAGINDGWDNIRDWSRRKTIEMSVSYNVNPLFSLVLSALNGQERATPRTDFGPLGMRTLIDLVATVHATDKLSFVANYDYGWQTKASLPNGSYSRAQWQGLAGYMNYQFSEKWQSSLRAEIFQDTNGFRTGVRQNWRAATLTVGYSPIKNAEIHAEIRHDLSNKSAFTQLNSTNTSHHNQSCALEALYKFG
ncbi:MAG: outer membrane beta-barrel protein [Gammaproteobacteria bacterium]|nr:outer membrane beta-barrel protein [Gammaproteobacteria bacterium]